MISKKLKRGTPNVGENVRDYKRERERERERERGGKCKKIKNTEMETCAMHLTFIHGCLTFIILEHDFYITRIKSCRLVIFSVKCGMRMRGEG